MEYNKISLTGNLTATPAFSHMSHGVSYFSFWLEVERLSGAADKLQVLAPEELTASLIPGDRLSIAGSLRSYNNKSGQGNRLIISALAREIQVTPDAPFTNTVELEGALCKPPIYRTTPLGREIGDLLLAVNRRYGRSDYLPCIVWGAQARMCAGLAVGDKLRVVGRQQSRKYTKVDGELEIEKTAFEVSLHSVEVVTELEGGSAIDTVRD